MFFLAISIPFLMAIGTSLAFPEPYPTRPCPSPTTTRAEKEKFLPPLTTLVTRLIWTTRSINSRPCASRSFSRSRGAREGPRLLFIGSPWVSKLQSAFAGGVGERFYLAVIDVAAAVKHDSPDPLFPGTVGHQFPDPLRGADVGTGLGFLLQPGVERGRVRESLAARVVDDLRVDVLAALEDRQSRAIHRSPDLLLDANANTAARFDSHQRLHGLLPARLPDLAPDDLVSVLDSLRLVRIGNPQFPDLGRGLAHLLPIGAGDGELARLGVERDRDSLRDGKIHGMRVADREDDRVPLDAQDVPVLVHLDPLRDRDRHFSYA